MIRDKLRYKNRDIDWLISSGIVWYSSRDLGHMLFGFTQNTQNWGLNEACTFPIFDHNDQGARYLTVKGVRRLVGRFPNPKFTHLIAFLDQHSADHTPEPDPEPDPRPWKLYLTNGCVVWAKCPEDALGPADSEGPVPEIDLTFIPDNAQVAQTTWVLE